MRTAIMSRESASRNEAAGELGIPSILDIDAEVKLLIEENNDPTFAANGMTGFKMTPSKYLFDDRQRLQAKVNLFYTGPSTRRTQRGIEYTTNPEGEGFLKEFSYSWDPLFPEDEKLQSVRIRYTDQLSGEVFQSVTAGFNSLDLRAIQQAVRSYSGEPTDV